MAGLWYVNVESWEHKTADYLVVIPDIYAPDERDEDGEPAEERDAGDAAMRYTRENDVFPDPDYGYAWGCTKIGDIDISAIATFQIVVGEIKDTDFREIGSGTTVWKLAGPPLPDVKGERERIQELGMQAFAQEAAKRGATVERDITGKKPDPNNMGPN